MGFDTYLDIVGRTAVSWRKQTGALPRLLFTRNDLVVEYDSSDAPVRVTFESTAAGVLKNLRTLGLGWDASVVAYAGLRSGAASEALLTGIYMGRLGPGKDDEIESLLAPQRSLSSDEDLHQFGTLLAQQWLSGSEVMLPAELMYDAPFETVGSLLFHPFDAATKAGMSPLAVGRAMETIMFLFREGRLVAWPLLISVLLQHIPGDSEVSYVLTEGIGEFELEDAATTCVFVDQWWDESAKSVADYTRTLGLLFGALSAFQSQLGQEFWFGQAAIALARLAQLNRDRATTTKKERGNALEHLVDVLIHTEEPDLKLLRKNFETDEEEIDLLLTNGLSHPFWIAYRSPFVLVECKNWAKPVGVKELRDFESKLEDRRGVARIGIFVSTSGYYDTFRVRLKTIQSRDVGVVFAVSLEDLAGLIQRRERLTDWLRGEGAIRAFEV
jgi:hypothetical protein